MVNLVVQAEKLEGKAMEWATKLAQGPIHSMGLSKRAFNKAHMPQLDEILEYEAQTQEIAGRGAEHKEGVRAFLEKRPPDYIGKTEGE